MRKGIHIRKRVLEALRATADDRGGVALHEHMCSNKRMDVRAVKHTGMRWPCATHRWKARVKTVGTSRSVRGCGKIINSS